MSIVALWAALGARPAAAAEIPVGTGLAKSREAIGQIEAARDPAAKGDAAFTLTELMTEHHTPALSVAVVRDYRLLWAKAYGVADEQAGLTANVETLFQAASISKPVSAMAVLKAVQDGHLGLDEDINTLLESWKLERSQEYLEKTAVTPRMLLSMTAGTTVSGFPGYLPTDPMPTLPQILGDGSGNETPANTDPVIVDWQPATKEAYSGGGSTILQLAMIDVLDRPFPEIIAKGILEPLGMANSCICQPLPTALDRNAARAYGSRVRKQREEGGHDAKWHVYPEHYAAGLWSTPTDLAKFMIEVQLSLAGRSDRVLRREMTEKMVTPSGIGSYALGFTVGSESPHRPAKPGERNRFFGHTGGNWGFRSNLDAHLEGGNGFIIMANSGESNPILFAELPRRIRAAYGWD